MDHASVTPPEKRSKAKTLCHHVMPAGLQLHVPACALNEQEYTENNGAGFLYRYLAIEKEADM